MQEMLDFVTNNGFAVVVALYLLIRNETTLKELSKVIEGNTKAIAIMAAKQGVDINGN